MIKKSYKQVVPWVLYDFANAPFSVIVLTFVYSTFFTKFLAPHDVTGTTLWSAVLASSGLVIGLLSPLFGSIADQTGQKKRWLIVFASIVIISTIILSFFGTRLGSEVFLLILVFIANCSYNFAQVFYNSLLIKVAPQEKWGRVSGLGWGLGYIGGLICLIITLVLFIPDVDQFNQLALGVKKSLWLVAAWFFIFSIPLFISFKEKKGSGISWSFILLGFSQLKQTMLSLKEYKTLLTFLCAYFFYSDGITTLLNFGGIFAATVLGFSFFEVLLFAIIINLIAGLGALAFGFVDDKFGPIKLILVALTVVSSCCFFIIIFQTELTFWIFGLILGVFIGPLQSASRSLLAKLAPEDKITEMFGLYAFTGKLSTFIGPFFISLLSHFFHSKTAGLYVVVLMLFIGLIQMIFLLRKNKKRGS